MAPLRVSRRVIFAVPLLATSGLAEHARAALEGDFYAFLSTVRRDAAAQGIRTSTIERALRNAEFLSHVIELDRKQPERQLTFGEYLEKVVTPQRIEDAREHLAENHALLDGIWRRYNVEPRFIVALWGIESDFGNVMGNYAVVSALATLGYDGRRSSYFRGELISALRIIDQGHIGADHMMGSWAGAMGQCQFMPSTFLGYAVDYDGDGRRDIWNDRGDVLASIANYLARLGWHGGESWGREVNRYFVVILQSDIQHVRHRSPSLFKRGREQPTAPTIAFDEARSQVALRVSRRAHELSAGNRRLGPQRGADFLLCRPPVRSLDLSDALADDVGRRLHLVEAAGIGA